MIPAASRPLTQQGMTGLKTPQISSAGVNRQVRDKSYYISAIRAHMNSINDEIKKMKSRLAEYKAEASNFEEVQSSLNALENELKEKQFEVQVYNMAIEMQMSKGSKDDLVEDTAQLKKENDRLEEIMQNDMLEMQIRRNDVAKAKAKLKKLSEDRSASINLLSPEDQQKYAELAKYNKDLEVEEDNMKAEMARLTTKIRELEHVTFKSERKKRYYKLMLRDLDIQGKIDKMNKEKKMKKNPAEERAILLEQARKNREDIEYLKAEEKELQEELSRAKERLSELDDELSENNSARLNKYRELLKRQETMDEFMSKYETTHKTLVEKIQESRANIDFSLEYMSENMMGSDLEDSQKRIDLFISNTNSTEEIMKELKKSQNILNMLTAAEEKYKKTLESTDAEGRKLEIELEQMNDIDSARDNIMDSIRSKKRQLESLKDLLHSTEMAVKEAHAQMKDIEMQLEGNDDYEEIIELNKKVQELTEENNQLMTSCEALEKLGNIEDFKNECFSYVKSINSALKKKY